MPIRNESPFDYYLQYVSEEINALAKLYPSDSSSSAGPELKVDRYPEIYNEVRMAYSHLARAVLGLSPDSPKLVQTILNPSLYHSFTADKGLAYPHAVHARDLLDTVKTATDTPYDRKDGLSNLRGAKNHLLRSLMDAKKGQYEMTELLVTDMFNQVLPKGIQNVGAGDLICRFEAHREKARNEYELGKLSETLGHHEQGVEHYSAAINAINQAVNLLESHRKEIDTAVRNRKKQQIRVALKLVVGIILIGITIFLLVSV